MIDKSKKIKVALLFGGKSAEHEVSLMSAHNIYKALDKKKYDVTVIGITRKGQWLTVSGEQFLSGPVAAMALNKHKGCSSISFAPARESFCLSKNSEEQTRFHVVFPVLHGPYGEDGSVQGLLRLIGIPHVGASVLGSAVGMDKDVMKRLMRDAGLPVGKFLIAHNYEKPILFSHLKNELGLPFFIKPANLGSSVGISRVDNRSQYESALYEAFRYDNKVLMEEYIDGREIECSVLGNENPIASVPGEVITDKTHHTFYSYDAKYLDEHGAELAIPAKLTKKQVKKVRGMAVQIFKILCCEGMGRVDFFLRDDGSFVVNEINTIPGFTAISMYPKLWEASGISCHELVDTLIKLAIERFKKEQKLLTSIQPIDTSEF